MLRDDFGMALCTSLIARFAIRQLATQCLMSLPRLQQTKVGDVELEMGLERNALLEARSLEAQKKIILALDQLVTRRKAS